MPYAEGRTFMDADSHVMELPDFLQEFADPSVRDRLPAISFAGAGSLGNGLKELGTRKAHRPERVEELVALGDGLIAGPKGYQALGAFNPSERSTALDLLGFDRQFVFSTFSAGTILTPGLEPEVAAGGARAHNRAMAAFCSSDDRLIGVGATTLDDPADAVAVIDDILELGLGAVWIPHRPAGGRSPGHDDLDPFWARAAEAGLPVVLHVGGSVLQAKSAWMNTGRPLPTDWLGGGENVRGRT
jgi:hypothetical protein